MNSTRSLMPLSLAHMPSSDHITSPFHTRSAFHEAEREEHHHVRVHNNLSASRLASEAQKAVDLFRFEEGIVRFLLRRQLPLPRTLLHFTLFEPAPIPSRRRLSSHLIPPHPSSPYPSSLLPS